MRRDGAAVGARAAGQTTCDPGEGPGGESGAGVPREPWTQLEQRAPGWAGLGYLGGGRPQVAERLQEGLRGEARMRATAGLQRTLSHTPTPLRSQEGVSKPKMHSPPILDIFSLLLENPEGEYSSF